MRAHLRAALLPLLLAACQCGVDHTARVQDALSASPASLTLPRTFIGYPTQAAVTAHNEGRASTHVVVSSGAPFQVSPAEFDLEGGTSKEVLVTFAPQEPGLAGGQLVFTAGEQSADVALAALGEAPPDCAAAGVCHTVTFDPSSGTCVTANAPEGSSCSSADACLSGPHCEKGLCVGGTLSCDDGDLCTRDLCDPAQGCVHLDSGRTCTVPSDPCLVAACDPKTGCGTRPARDGTPCGSIDCVTANVCLAGACRAVPVPEGANCSLDTPCQAHGSCHGGNCVRPAPSAMTPLWTAKVASGRSLSFPGLADDDGNVYWVESHSGSDSRCCNERALDYELVSVTRDGLPRYRKPLAGIYCAPQAPPPPASLAIFGDVLVSGLANDVVEARRLVDGTPAWSFDVRTLLAPELKPGMTAWSTPPCVRFQIRELAESPAATVLLHVIGRASDGFHEELQGEWLVQLDARTGARRNHFAVDIAGGTTLGEEGLAVDELSNIYAGKRQLSSWAPSGKPRWSASTFALPTSVVGNRLFLQFTALDPTTGAPMYQLPPPSPYFNGAVLSSALSGVVIQQELTGNRSVVTRFAPASGATTSTTPLVADPSAPSFATPPRLHPILLDNGSVLVDFGEGGERYLAEVDPQGAIQYACKLPDVLTTDGTDASLRNGRYAFSTVISDAAAGYVTAVLGFDLGKREPSPVGWATHAGDMKRTRRAR